MSADHFKTKQTSADAWNFCDYMWLNYNCT